MSEHVKVEDLEIFSQFRAAVVKFAQAAEQSLANADAYVARTHSWLENEQTSHWQSQLRKRTEAATQARDAVRQKKLYKDSSGRMQSAVEEEKILKRCLAALEESQNKLLAIRKSIPRLEKEAGLYRGGVSALGRNLTGEIPKAVALLDRLQARLLEYVQMESAAFSGGDSAAPAPAGGMARGADQAPPPADEKPTATASPDPGTTPSQAPGQETSNVAHG
jgi:hypothetical protein